jgi:hypothetical protein
VYSYWFASSIIKEQKFEREENWRETTKVRVCWGPLLVIITKRETGTYQLWLALRFFVGGDSSATDMAWTLKRLGLCEFEFVILSSHCNANGLIIWQSKDKTVTFYLYIYKKNSWVSSGFTRVDRVLPGQFPSGFLPPPGPVPDPGRPGPGSTRQAGPGFKTLAMALSCTI